MVERAALWPVVGQQIVSQSIANTEANTFATNGTENFVAITGNNFTQEIGTPGVLTFLGAACQYRNDSGKALVLCVRCIAVLENPAGSNIFGSLAIDLAADLIGTTSNTSTTEKGQMQVLIFLGGGFTNSAMIVTERIIELAPLATFQPVYGATTGGAHIGADTPIDRLSIVVRQVGVAP